NYLTNRYETNYFLAEDFEVDANEMDFEVRLKNTSPGQFLNCKYFRIALLTTHGMIEIPFVQEGCKSLLKMWASDLQASYIDRPMDQYETRDFDWETISIKTQDKTVRIYRNGALIDEINYQEPLGQLTCIRLKFEGNGIIDYVTLKDEASTGRYHNDFSKEEEQMEVN
ncbi:MAG: hypothetical protein AAF705_12535, partial [Bacteroidota bacterium]